MTSIRVYFRTTRRKADPQVDTDGLFVRISCDGFRQLSKVSYDNNGIRKDGHRIPWYNTLRYSLSLAKVLFLLAWKRPTDANSKSWWFFVFCFFYLYPGLYSVKKNLYCTLLKRLFSRSSLTSLRYWITEHRLLGSTLYFSPWHFSSHVLLNSCTDETNGNRKCSSRDEHQTSITGSFATNYVNSRNRSFSTKQCDSKSK